MLGIAAGMAVFVIHISRAASYMSDQPETCMNCHVITTYIHLAAQQPRPGGDLQRLPRAARQRRSQVRFQGPRRPVACHRLTVPGTAGHQAFGAGEAGRAGQLPALPQPRGGRGGGCGARRATPIASAGTAIARRRRRGSQPVGGHPRSSNRDCPWLPNSTQDPAVGGRPPRARSRAKLQPSLEEHHHDHLPANLA